MLDALKKNFISLKEVFSKVKYVLLALAFGFLFYLLNFLITTYGNISSFYKAQGILKIIPFTFNLFVGFKDSILLSSFISMIVLSLLTGILFSLILYKINLKKRISQKNSFLAGAGMFLGIFAPGCVACGLGLAALFGLAASFATLPLKGLEISILAGMIIIAAIFRFSYTLSDNTCRINFNARKSERRLKNLE